MLLEADALPKAVQIPIDGGELGGTLWIPNHAKGIVLFAHSRDSGRFDTRNQYVAEILHGDRFGTLLFDLLLDAEAEDRNYVYDINLLVKRLEAATAWIHEQPESHQLPLGYFGTDTGAAAALIVAANRGTAISAVVSRGGRPDLAIDFLSLVKSPTLLIVVGDAPEILNHNRQALAHLRCEKRLSVIQGDGHLFPEPGALMEAAVMASEWFEKHFKSPANVATNP